MIDRRRSFSRYGLNLPGSLFPVDGSGTNCCSVIVRDLSLGGGLMLSPKAIAVGTLWRLKIEVQGQSIGGELTFLVRSCRPSDSGGFRVGCQNIAAPSFLRAVGTREEELTSEALALAAAGLCPAWKINYNLIAKGELSVATLVAMTVSIAADLTVSEKIVDCTLDIAGRLVGQHASLAGGSANVLRGISIGHLGGTDNRPTRVVLGASLKTSETLAAAVTQLASRKALIKKKQAKVAELNARTSSTLSHSERELLTVIMCELPELEQHAATFEANTVKLKNREAGLRQIRLEVAEMIHPGVTVIAADTQVTFSKEVAGPVVLGLTPNGEFDIVGDHGSSLREISNLATIVRRAA